MSTHLITGFAGREHITAADQGSFNAAVMGGGEFVLERGEQFRCQVISNNKVRIYDGDILMQGRHIMIDRNTYEETTHENGTQGYLRNDLIVLTYEKNSTTGVETAKIEVIKGTPAESNPTVPEYVSGDILDGGALKNQMPLYKVPFNGLSIGVPVKLFSTVPTLEGMKNGVDAEVDAKMEELDNKFATLEASVDEKIADAGKPLSSNADDWGLIENYGEYSADAKTVGEEFTKVNSSLQSNGSCVLLAEIKSPTAEASANFLESLSNYKYVYIDVTTNFDQNPTAMIPVAVLTESYNVNISSNYSDIKFGITVFINLDNVKIHRVTLTESSWTLNSLRIWGVK